MQRPLFETDADKKRESEFSAKICEIRKVKMHKLPISYRLDFMVTDLTDRTIALAEIKCRSNASTAYPSFAISLAKYEQGIRLTEHLCHDLTNAPIMFLLFVRFTDKDLYYKHDQMNASDIHVRWGGRIWDVRDADDREPMVYIPISLFKEL